MKQTKSEIQARIENGVVADDKDEWDIDY